MAFQITTESIKAFEASNLKMVKLIVFDVEMAVYARSQGYDVEDRFTSSGRKKLEVVSKGVANEYIKEALQMRLDFILFC